VVLFLAVPALLAAAVLTALMVVLALGAGSGSVSPLVAAGWGVGLFMSLGLLYTVVLVGPFSVRDGVMILKTPIRLMSGRRTRRISLGELLAAERLGGPGVDPGVLFSLKDGTRFSVFDEDLPSGGTEFLNALVEVLGI